MIDNPFGKTGVPSVDVVLMNCGIDRLLFAHEDHFLFGTGNCRIQQIPVEHDTVCKGVPENAEDSFGSMLVGRTGSTNITNCVAINVSGKKIFAVGTAGLTVGSCTEQAPASNKIYDSWEAYEADKGNISIDDWAEEYISTAKNS